MKLSTAKQVVFFVLVVLVIHLLYSYLTDPIVKKPMYSDDSGFYITLQYEIPQDYQMGDDMGKLFGKHSRSTLLDTGSMWIDIGSVMNTYDKNVFKQRLDNLKSVGGPNLLVTDLNYEGDVIEGEKSKGCKETNDTPDQVETYFVQGLVHFTPSVKFRNLIGYSTIDDSCNHPQWYNDIQEGSTTVLGLDQQMKLPITKYKTYDPTTFKDWKFQDLNAIGNLIKQQPRGRKNIELDCYNLTCSVGRLNLFPSFMSTFTSQGIGDNSMFYFVMTNGEKDFNVLFDTGTAVTWIENPRIQKSDVGRLYGKSTDQNNVSGYLDFNVLLSQGDPSMHAQKISETQEKKKEYMKHVEQTKPLNYHKGIDLIFGRSDMLQHRIFIDYDHNRLEFY
jgi:hypothetical protein